MSSRHVRQGPAKNPGGKPWTGAILCEDVALSRQLARRLEHADFCFACAHPETIEKLAGGLATFDLVLIYVARERADGSIPRELLRRRPGCVVLLGRPATGIERAWWIENGADDCLSHPWDKEEVLARLRASIRRRQAACKPSAILTVGGLSISLQQRSASLDGRRLELTSCEFALLAALAARPGQVLGREQLLELAKGSAEQTFDRAIDVQISRLRAKLRDDSRAPRILKTVRGVGYVLVATEAAASSP